VQFGHLQVNANAANSQVYVDGTYRGVASPGQPLNLQNIDVGQVNVRVTAQNYKEKTDRATLQAGEWTQIVVKLEPVSVAPPPIVDHLVTRPSVSSTSTTRKAGQTLTARLPGGASMEFVWIESGTFTMGSPVSEAGRSEREGPQHRVTISRGFYLGKYEITQGQWEAVMGTRPWSGKEYVQSNANHPAVYISWDDMQSFVRRLNQVEGSEKYRLPTEAEWEYACRAGATTRWPFGDRESDLGAYAWYNDNSWKVGLQYAQLVGQKRPNAWGLCDMLGNVLEWCQDYLGDYSGSTQIDPTGPTSGSHRVGRGGRFRYDPRTVRPADRGYYAPGHRSGGVGARLLRTR
jgi:formylglycine-generating enzyme required for sulfatase activity